MPGGEEDFCRPAPELGQTSPNGRRVDGRSMISRASNKKGGKEHVCKTNTQSPPPSPAMADPVAVAVGQGGSGLEAGVSGAAMAMQQMPIAGGGDAHHQPPVVAATIDTVIEASPQLDDDDNPNDSAEEKRQKRMRRNRESAAQSRNRKKQYVESLESQIGQLQDTVRQLHGENYDLRREHARLTGQPDPAPPAELMTAVVTGTPANDGQMTVAIHHGIGDEGAEGPLGETAPAVAVASVIAPSPRSSEAMHGLEMLARSASHGTTTHSLSFDDVKEDGDGGRRTHRDSLEETTADGSAGGTEEAAEQAAGERAAEQSQPSYNSQSSSRTMSSDANAAMMMQELMN
jgi:hypothetical protein